MRTALRNRKLTTGLTVLGAAGIATATLTGTAHAADQPEHGKPAAQTRQLPSADTFAQHLSTQAAHAKAAKADRAAKADAGKKTSADNLDGWIREARAIMKKNGIPGSYEGIKRNVIRESAGDPDAVNGWDVNAQKGTPSRGLLQVIQPTFDQYHVKGTADKLTDPVANIVAACNYAADRYGSMDQVDSAY